MILSFFWSSDPFTAPGGCNPRSDVLILLVAHTPFRDLALEQDAFLTSARLVFDTVNTRKPDLWESAGFTPAVLEWVKHHRGQPALQQMQRTYH